MSSGLNTDVDGRHVLQGREDIDDTRVRVKNRRRRYLDLHPEYYNDGSREIADPLLYGRLVRRFMTAEERELQGRRRGFAGALEADLTRSEAKLEALNRPDPTDPMIYVKTDDGMITGVEQDPEARPENREDALQQWKEIITQRFIRGMDRDFDYNAVDADESLDDQAEQDRGELDNYLEDEDEQFIGDGNPQGETGIQDF